MIREAIARLIDRSDLSGEEMTAVMEEMMSGRATEAQIGAFLTALRMKGETVEEIAAAAAVMRAKATPVPAPPGVIDTCGTGGDGLHTFNISTAAALVAAGAGAVVAKHGNRSVSSSSGSSQVLEALGVNVNADVSTVAQCIAGAGIGFLFAPMLHGAMKHAIGPRKEMGVRTIFNLLGPLTNPAGARRQLVGVYASSLVEPVAEVLRALGSERALIVHGHDGLDEITTTDETAIAILADGEVKTMVIGPDDFGLPRARMEELQVDSPEASAGMIRSVLDGEEGAARDIVLLNAAAALYVSGRAEDIAAGIEQAAQSIDSRRARDTLGRLATLSRAT